MVDTLAEIAKHPGRKALKEIACVANPGTILPGYRKLVAKIDGYCSIGVRKSFLPLIVNVAVPNRGAKSKGSDSVSSTS